jgi:hypothetical protein
MAHDAASFILARNAPSSISNRTWNQNEELEEEVVEQASQVTSIIISNKKNQFDFTKSFQSDSNFVDRNNNHGQEVNRNTNTNKNNNNESFTLNAGFSFVSNQQKFKIPNQKLFSMSPNVLNVTSSANALSAPSSVQESSKNYEDRFNKLLTSTPLINMRENNNTRNTVSSEHHQLIMNQMTPIIPKPANQKQTIVETSRVVNVSSSNIRPIPKFDICN